MKKTVLAIALCLSFTQVHASNLVNVDIKKSSDSAVDVTFYTDGGSGNPMVTRKSDNKYVVLMPNTTGHGAVSPDISGLKDIITDVDVKNVDDGMNGYTKVTFITKKPLNIKTYTQKANPITTEESAAKSVIVYAKNKQLEKTVEPAKPTVKQETKVSSDSNKTENKPKNNEVKKSTLDKKTPMVAIPKVKEQTVQKVIEKTEPLVKTEPEPQAVQTESNEVLNTPVKENNKIEYTWALMAFPIIFLFLLLGIVKNSLRKSDELKSSFKQNLMEEPYKQNDYEDIISDEGLNWQERYKKFVVKSDDNKTTTSHYSFIKPIGAVSETDKARLELENTLQKTPDIYKNQQIDISEEKTNEVVSEDIVIVEDLNEFKLKAFAKPTSLTSSHRSHVTKLLPKYTHAKEGKFIKLFDTPLNATSRKFKNSNLKVSDLINTGSKYLQDNNKDVEIMEKEQEYLMSSIDEYFSLLDNDKASKVTNPNKNLSQKVAASLAGVKPSMKIKKPMSPQVSNPIAQSSKKDYLSGLIIKDTYNIDDNKSFHIVNLDGVSALIGRINEEVSVLKKFNSVVDSFQVRPDGENVYMIRAGNFKTLVDSNNMGVLIEL